MRALAISGRSGVTLLEILQPESVSQQGSSISGFACKGCSRRARTGIARACAGRASIGELRIVSPRALAGAIDAEKANEREHSDANGSLRRRASVRRSYLSTRKNEIFQCRAQQGPHGRLAGAGGRVGSVEVSRAGSGDPQAARGLAPTAKAPLPPIAALDELSRARFLVALVGPAAASWPALRDLREEQLLGAPARAGRAVHEPESFTLAAIERGAVAELDVANASAVDVALALNGALPDPAWLDSGESLVNHDRGPLSLALALARAFRLRGELGRALALLGDFQTSTHA